MMLRLQKGQFRRMTMQKHNENFTRDCSIIVVSSR
jgi:hypothetical protein